MPFQVWVLVGVITALCGAYFYGHHAGFAQRDQEMQVEIARKNDQERAKEQALTQQLHDRDQKLKEANNAIDQKQSALDRAIRAGRVRLPAAGCVQASPSAAPAASSGTEAASESERQTLAAIAAIVAQGDRNTEQLNACIDAYNQMRETINGQR